MFLRDPFYQIIYIFKEIFIFDPEWSTFREHDTVYPLSFYLGYQAILIAWLFQEN